MLRVKGGCRDAFACLVRRHQQPLLNFFYRMGAYNDAEDLAQDTFVRLYRYRKRWRPRAKLTTFLYTLARHVWIDALRKRKRGEQFREQWKEHADTVDEGGHAALRARLDVSQALAALPEKLRDVVVLSVYQGMRYRDIGAILKIPEGTVKSRMFLAMNRLKEVLGERAR